MGGSTAELLAVSGARYIECQSNDFFLSSVYAVIADGPNSSLQLETTPGWFIGAGGGMERSISNRVVVGLQLGYQQQGIRESGETRFRDGEREPVRNGWTIHQLATPIYGLYRLGKPEARLAAYLRLTLVVTLAESGALRGVTFRPRPAGLNGDGEVGV